MSFAMLNKGEATQLAFSTMMVQMHTSIIRIAGKMISNHKLKKKSNKKERGNMTLITILVARLKVCLIWNSVIGLSTLQIQIAQINYH